MKCGFVPIKQRWHMFFLMPWTVIDIAEHVLMRHVETTIVKGKKRKKRTFCDTTGKYWFEQLPDIQEVK